MKRVVFGIFFLCIVFCFLGCEPESGDHCHMIAEAEDLEGHGDEHAPGSDGPESSIVEQGPVIAPPDVLGAMQIPDENPDPDIVEVTLVAMPMDIELLPGTTTRLWTYNGLFPGPMIRAKQGDRLIVHFHNNLPETTTVHWHGMRLPNAMDGSPMVQDPVEPGGTFEYEFTLTDAGTYWYHPHIRTNEQVERGLYGAIVVHERQPPEYDVERIFALDDIRLVPETGDLAAFTEMPPDNMHGRHGNVLLINGAPVDEKQELAIRPGSVERWRLLNSANGRFAEIDVPGAEWRVIASDGGILPEPYTTQTLTIAPGERYDIEVRWKPENSNDTAKFRYHVPVIENDEVVIWPVTMLNIVSTQEPELEEHEIRLPIVTLPDYPVLAHPTMVVELDGGHMSDGTVKWFLNDKAFGDHEPIMVDLDSHHVIDFVNKSPFDHPLHIHGHFFKVIDKIGTTEERTGYKDTVVVPGEETVRISMIFDNPGGWMYHCHILEHAKVGMMGVIMVVDPDDPDAMSDMDGKH